MTNKIIDGMSLAIAGEFGEEYRIYTEPVEQGLEEPCFSIVPVHMDIGQLLGGRSYRNNKFCVHYFPREEGEEGETEECLAVLERLYDCMEIIEIDGQPARGTNMSAETSDRMIHFFVNYNVFTRKTEEHDTMADVRLAMKLKGGEDEEEKGD